MNGWMFPGDGFDFVVVVPAVVFRSQHPHLSCRAMVSNLMTLKVSTDLPA